VLKRGMVLFHLHNRSVTDYLNPEEGGGIGPRQWPFSFVTGWSSLGHHTVNSPLVRRTSTIIALDTVSL